MKTQTIRQRLLHSTMIGSAALMALVAAPAVTLMAPTVAVAQDFTTGTLQADLSLKPEPTFDVKHVADAVLYMANLPLEANVLFMTVMATKMPYVGRG